MISFDEITEDIYMNNIRYVNLEIKIMHKIVTQHPEILSILIDSGMTKTAAAAYITKIAALSLEYCGCRIQTP